MYPRVCASLLLASLCSLNPMAATAGGNICGNGTITTFPGSDNVFTVTANSDGTYAVSLCSPTSLDLPPFPSFAIADVNHDGSPDMLFGDSSDADAGIQVLLNDGTGVVVLDHTLATGAQKANGPRNISAMDLNGDGWADIVTGNGPDDTVSVLLSDAHGGFAAARVYAVGLNPDLVQIEDTNKDGLLDILVMDVSAGTENLLLNNGDGTFTAQGVTSLAGSGTGGSMPGSGSSGGVTLTSCNSNCASLGTSGGSAMVKASSIAGTVTGGASVSITTSSTTTTGAAKTSAATANTASGSGGSGGFDGFSLLLLGFTLLRRRVVRAS